MLLKIHFENKKGVFSN